MAYPNDLKFCEQPYKMMRIQHEKFQMKIQILTIEAKNDKLRKIRE